MNRIIVAIHGIRTRETANAWQERFQLYVSQQTTGIQVIEREYYEWATPILNMLKNRRLARDLTDELLPYARHGMPISFVTHSNGADIGLRTVKLLAKSAQRTAALVCIAGVLHPDIAKNGISDLVKNGALGQAVAYCSKQDRVLAGIPELFLWPYGRLGAEGFNDHGREPLTSRVITRWRPLYVNRLVNESFNFRG